MSRADNLHAFSRLEPNLQFNEKNTFKMFSIFLL